MTLAACDHGLDEEAVKAALIANTPRLRAFIAAKLPSRVQQSICIDDVLQEIWIAAFRTRASLRIDRPDAVDRWLISIAQNQVLNTIKVGLSLKRGGEVRIIHSGPKSYADLFSYIASRNKTPSSEVASGEASRAVQEALATLPPARREVLIEHFIHGKSCEQIAADRKRSTAAINSLVFHGLRQLQTRLGPSSAYLSDAASSDKPPGEAPDRKSTA